MTTNTTAAPTAATCSATATFGGGWDPVSDQFALRNCAKQTTHWGDHKNCRSKITLGVVSEWREVMVCRYAAHQTQYYYGEASLQAVAVAFPWLFR